MDTHLRVYNYSTIFLNLGKFHLLNFNSTEKKLVAWYLQLVYALIALQNVGRTSRHGAAAGCVVRVTVSKVILHQADSIS